MKPLKTVKLKLTGYYVIIITILLIALLYLAIKQGRLGFVVN
ncbi:MAG: hypothetical protein U9O94_10640 [Nanoarchaeota archaeon]|nr:hypothetical protein [Nanoarchaeota archaeon]